jgi:hypothetical protein
MAPLKWIAGLVLAGSLVSCAPQVTDATTDATTPDDGSTDIASSFVSDLIANATAAEQEQQAQEKRFLSCTQDDSLVVNLGYAKYRGYHDASTGLNYWKGSEHLASSVRNLLTSADTKFPLVEFATRPLLWAT